MKKNTKTKKNSTPSSVDEYLASIPEPGRSTLKKMRSVIRKAAPKDTIETISYGIPTFRYKGPLIWFGAFSGHCSLFPTASVIELFKDELKNYPISKGTIRFPLDKPLPAALVTKMVRARVKQVE
ncbi:MAG TPA: DUF1801 domain-containing protein [Candidatus Sulfotelmatobacter sp.]